MSGVVKDLHAEIGEIRKQIQEVDQQARDAKQAALEAREEVLRLRDVVAAAQRDQQDLKALRTRLNRIQARGLLARILNRQ